MALELRHSRRALSDPDRIFSHISHDSPAAAADMVGGIRRTIETPREFPFAGRRTERDHVRLPTVSRPPFRIFYLLGANLIVILHVRQAAQRPL